MNRRQRFHELRGEAVALIDRAERGDDVGESIERVVTELDEVLHSDADHSLGHGEEYPGVTARQYDRFDRHRVEVERLRRLARGVGVVV